MSILENLPNRFQLTGLLVNVFKSPEWSKDGNSGGGDFRLQLMASDKLRNGETKTSMTEVSVGLESSVIERYKKELNKVITLPVTLFSVGNEIRAKLASS